MLPHQGIHAAINPTNMGHVLERGRWLQLVPLLRLLRLAAHVLGGPQVNGLPRRNNVPAEFADLGLVAREISATHGPQLRAQKSISLKCSFVG